VTTRIVTPGYRPQLRWLVLGPLLGVFSGTAVAFVFLEVALLLDGPVPSAMGLLAGIAPVLLLAVVFGGTTGAAVGLLAGVPLVFLVGRHLPRPVARRRAMVLGALLPPLALLALPSLLTGQLGGTGVDVPEGREWLGLGWFAAAAVLGGSLAARAVSRILPHAEVG
jgi:hypothetical protein